MKGLAHPPWPIQAPTPEAVAEILPAIAESFLANGDKAARPNTTDLKLHGFRLNAKEFRYTLEAFRALYGPTLGRHIGNVRRVQTVLGDLNDCRATADLLAPLEGADPAGVEQLRRFLEERRLALRAKFIETWQSLYGDERARRLLLQYLRRPVAARPSAEI